MSNYKEYKGEYLGPEYEGKYNVIVNVSDFGRKVVAEDPTKIDEGQTTLTNTVKGKVEEIEKNIKKNQNGPNGPNGQNGGKKTRKRRIKSRSSKKGRRSKKAL
jgi:hypothetical protein